MSLLETRAAKMLRIWREKWAKLIKKREKIIDFEPKTSQLAPQVIQILPKRRQKGEQTRCHLVARKKMYSKNFRKWATFRENSGSITAVQNPLRTQRRPKRLHMTHMTISDPL